MPNQFGKVTLDEMLAAGAANTVYWMERIGRSENEIKAQLVRQYGQATDRTLNAVINRTNVAVQAGERLANANPNFKLDRANVPINAGYQSTVPGNPQPYFVYTTIVAFPQRNGGGLGYATIQIEAETSLTVRELSQAVVDEWAAISEGLRGSDRIRGNVSREIHDIDITMVWRTR